MYYVEAYSKGVDPGDGGYTDSPPPIFEVARWPVSSAPTPPPPPPHTHTHTFMVECHG